MKMESLLAEYLGVEDAISFSMGFATNALNLPTLVGKVGFYENTIMNSWF